MEVPETVAEDGAYYPHVPLFAGKALDDGRREGRRQRRGDRRADEAGKLLARGRIDHCYPHSWRSKAPVIFRNTPQWFIAMDKPIAEIGGTLREKALAAIDATRFLPRAGHNRLRSMIESGPTGVSRQRAWGVPIAMFVDKKTGEPLHDPEVMARIVEPSAQEGADAWFDSPPERFLGNKYKAQDYEKVTDILDVWFDSGSTHVFTLEGNPDLNWPADLYLEGSDQHRGWFQSSLLESCGTRGRAPYDGVLTHGFTLDEQGRKMSKSLGNITAPQTVCDQYGADILRLWVVGTDYTEDQRIGPEILKHQADAYRQLRNTLRYLLGSLDGYSAATEKVAYADMPELERWVLHRLAELDAMFRQAVEDFDFHTIATELHNFCAVDLSAFYFDIRKDAIYCDAPKALAPARRAHGDGRAVLLPHRVARAHHLLHRRGGLARPAQGLPDGAKESVHLRALSRDPGRLARCGAGREVEDRARRCAASSPARWSSSAPRSASAPACRPRRASMPRPSTSRRSRGSTSARSSSPRTASWSKARGRNGAFTLPDVAGVAVEPLPAQGNKCARCWQVLEEVGKSAQHPLLCRRCEAAVDRHEADRPPGDAPASSSP